MAVWNTFPTPSAIVIHLIVSWLRTSVTLRIAGNPLASGLVSLIMKLTTHTHHFTFLLQGCGWWGIYPLMVGNASALNVLWPMVYIRWEMYGCLRPLCKTISASIDLHRRLFLLTKVVISQRQLSCMSERILIRLGCTWLSLLHNLSVDFSRFSSLNVFLSFSLHCKK